MAVIAVDVIGDAILAGIKRAQTDYERFSGGEWLWAASEYVLTTYIAQEISGLQGSKYVTIESGGMAALSDAGVRVPGPKPRKARLRGRFDLLLWQADARPRAIIEVKNQPSGPSGWFHDIERIAAVLQHGRGTSSIKFGAFAYYYSAVDGARFCAREKVLRKFNSVEQSIARHKLAQSLRIRQLVSDVHQEGDSAWGAACLIFQLA